MNWKNILLTLLLGVLFFQFLIVFPQKIEIQVKEPEATQGKTFETDGPDQKMQGVHFVESQKGARDWEMFALTAEGNQGQGTWKLKKVKVQFYNAEKIEFTVVGDVGNIDSQTKDISIKGNVKTTSVNGYLFESDEIKYSASKRILQTPTSIKVTGPKDQNGDSLIVQGQKLIAYVDDKKMIIPESVSARKTLKNGITFSIQSKNVEFSSANNQARFYDKVVMSYQKMKIEGPEAILVYGNAKDFLSSILMSGGVQIYDEDKFASSANLNLDLITNQFHLTGKPKLIQNEDEISGDEILFLDGGKKVKVENTKK